MDDFWFEFVEITQTVGDGLLFGATYALIGIGFTLIFGAMGKLNMTYAAASLAGAYVGLAAFTFVGAPAPLVFLVIGPRLGAHRLHRVRGLLQVHPDRQPPRRPDGLDRGACSSSTRSSCMPPTARRSPFRPCSRT